MAAVVSRLPGITSSLVQYRPRGGAWHLFQTEDREVLLDGPAGTGKTFACLWRLHTAALSYPGMRALMLRKTLSSLTGSALVTYQNQILGSGSYGVVAYGGSKFAPAEFRYPNGSRIVVGGMDKASKVMSAEYDLVYANEATELTEGDWEALTTRLRNGKMPFQQLLGDCNPDTMTHWLNQRCNAGKTKRLYSRHHHNPLLYNTDAKAWTTFGAQYMATLMALSGVRRKRLYDGLWVAAEGQVYEGWDAERHLIDSEPIPYQWPRYWVIDFGFVHPFVWQAWAMKPDGDLVMYREIYMTHRLVTQHARRIMEITAGEPRPTEVITDHDAEDRATFEAATGYTTTPARKNVSGGIQAVANRLDLNSPPNAFYMRDARDELDLELVTMKKPTRTVEEYPSYTWNLSANRRKGEEPVKLMDDGMDATRYLVAHFDLAGGSDAIEPASGALADYLDQTW